MIKYAVMMFALCAAGCEDEPYIPRTPEQTTVQVKESGVVVQETVVKKTEASGQCKRECMGLRYQCLASSPPGFLYAFGCRRQFNGCLETCQ